jgi:hypothetical protein
VVETDKVDFGVLDDRGVANLSSAAMASYQIEYGPATGSLREKNDTFARANPQNFRNMPRYYDQVQEWERAFVAQRRRVASGGARDAREGQMVQSSARICAIWSLKVMPFCTVEAMTLPVLKDMSVSDRNFQFVLAIGRNV